MIPLKTPLSKSTAGAVYALIALGCLRGTFIEENPTKPLLLFLLFGGLALLMFRLAYRQYRTEKGIGIEGERN